jgi:macrodomain Ter protein organizer (MatP/YcbG family)
VGEVIMYHRKYLDRLCTIFLEKNTKEGPVATKEWADRTLNPELFNQLVSIIHKKRK